MMNNTKPSVSCPGEPLFFAGAGLEMTEARFPEGYGVKLAKGDHLMSVVAFYHKAPPTKDVMASFTMYMAPKSKPVKEMDVYQVGVNIVCYSKFGSRGADQTDEGIEIRPGVQVHTAPLKFSMDGCVKFAYPHGHDELLMRLQTRPINARCFGRFRMWILTEPSVNSRPIRFIKTRADFPSHNRASTTWSWFIIIRCKKLNSSMAWAIISSI
jgi:hypothetical protein